ncbi:MAG: dTDP-4-dehydrorhamnose reductase [Bdellovibrionales bacterium]
MKKVVILGSSGQLGSDLDNILSLKQDIFTVGLSREHFDAESETLSPAITAHSDADYIINCVAYTNVEGCEIETEIANRINHEFTKKVALFCKINSIVLFQISTDYVFNGIEESPIKEDHPPQPINQYGKTKWLSEVAVQELLEKFFIFRVSSLFGRAGAEGKGGNFVETMIQLASQGKSLSVIEDQFMCPTHTLDVAKAITHFIENEISDYGIYHCSNQESTNWFGFAKTILSRTNISADLKPIQACDYPSKVKRPQFSVLDTSKLTRYYEMPSWKQALDKYLSIKGYVK